MQNLHLFICPPDVGSPGPPVPATVVRYLLGNELLLHLYVVVWKPWNGKSHWIAWRHGGLIWRSVDEKGLFFI